MSFMRLLCLINSHRPIRKDVYRSEGQWAGKCRYCGCRIRRKARGKWRLDFKGRL